MTRLPLSAALAGVSMVALSHAAGAADLPLSSKIDAVTVFPDGAVVTRLGEIAIPAGAHQVILQGLPQGVDPASIRVEGAADRALSIGSAEMKTVPADVRPDSDALRKLRELRGELAGVNGRIDAGEMQKRTIERFSITTPEASAKEGKPIDVAQWRAVWTAVGEGAAEINAQLIALRAKAADLDAEIKSIEATMARGRPNLAPRLDVAVAVEADKDSKAKLKISYRVRNARWAPVYDAHLTTGSATAKPKIALVRRANITQTTGEEWTDASIVLSTTRVAGGVAAPELGSQVVNIFDPPPPIAYDAARPRMAPPAAPMVGRGAAQPAEALAKAEAPEQRADEREATTESTAFSAEYRVPGRVTVAKDGAAKSVRLASREIEPELQVRATPALDTTAYLTARFANAEEAPLLPGEMLLHRDGAFVGKTRIGLTAAGDQLDLGFGADDRVKIERAPVKKRENDPSWYTSSKFQMSDVRTVITNLHQRPMRVTIHDRIPVSENTAITVEQLRETTPPTEKQVGDKRGVMGWSWEMQPNEKKEVRVAYRMKWPSDRDIRMSSQGGR